MDEKQPEYRYWFVVYQAGPIVGNIIVKQNLPGEGVTDNGFNHASMLNYLWGMFNLPVVITFFQQTNATRYNQFQALLRSDRAKAFGFHSEAAHPLKPVDGTRPEGVEGSAPKGQLRAVTTEAPGVQTPPAETPPDTPAT